MEIVLEMIKAALPFFQHFWRLTKDDLVGLVALKVLYLNFDVGKKKVRIVAISSKFKRAIFVSLKVIWIF